VVAILLNVRNGLQVAAGFERADIKEMHAYVGHRGLESFIVLWKG